VTLKRARRPVASHAIAPSGYRITNGCHRGVSPVHRVVTAEIPSSWTTPPKLVPLTEDAFVEFATQCLTEADVERLANRFGFLGTEQDYDAVRDLAGNWSTTTAEPVSTWLKQAAALRYFLDFWRDLQNPDADVQRQAFAIFLHGEFLPETPMGLPLPTGHGRAMATDADRPPIRLESGNDLNLVMREFNTATAAGASYNRAWKRLEGAKRALEKATKAARQAPTERPYGYRATLREARHARRQAKEVLQRRGRRCDTTARQLGWTLLGLSITAHLRSLHVVPTLVQSGLPPAARSRQVGSAPMALEFYAPHLLGLFWLQLATAVSKQVTYRQCRGCGNHLAIHRDGYRRHRWTCSNACRQRVSRATRRTPSGDHRHAAKPRPRQ